ncbi:MAG: MATE family efflux transporter [Synergistaceae bacterium]|nr:MATE family efflux transporter [Synergistaceae bacterium]
MNSQDRKYTLMTTHPVSKLVLRLAVPSIITMMISAIYNMADTYYVAGIDVQSPAAVGVIFSYMAFIQAVAFFFGQGSANYISRALGARDRRSAELIASTGFFTSLLTGIMIAALGFVFMDDILHILGSTDTILPYARAYFRYILIGTPFIMSSFVLNNQMRFQGNAFVSMLGITSGALLNIILDPVFIFVFGMGVAGASLATMISQFVSFMLLLTLSGRRDGIPLRLGNFRPTLAHYREIAAGGLPSLGRQGLASISMAYMNQLAGAYGDTAIAALSIVFRVTMFATSIVLGFGQGFQPVCGFNYGAGKYERVRRAFWFSVGVTAVYCASLSIAGYAFAERIIALFRPDDLELIALGSQALRYECLVYWSVSFVTISNMYLQNTRRTIRATTLAASRQGFMLALALHFGRKFFGLTGIISAQPVADGLTFLLAVPFTWSALREMRGE